MELIDFLLKDELSFNAEIHLLGTGEKRVEMIPDHGDISGGGWILTFSDTEAGEWNLAKPFGLLEKFLPALSAFPKGVLFQLLVPESLEEIIRKEIKTESAELLVVCRSTGLLPDIGENGRKKFDMESLASGESPFPRWAEKEFSMKFLEDGAGTAYHWRLRGFILLENSIVSLVKTIHSTSRTGEVYIETIPQWRGKGLGSLLLRNFAKRVFQTGRILIYTVSCANFASLRVAEKLQLFPYQCLCRFPFVNSK